MTPGIVPRLFMIISGHSLRKLGYFGPSSGPRQAIFLAQGDQKQPKQAILGSLVAPNEICFDGKWPGMCSNVLITPNWSYKSHQGLKRTKKSPKWPILAIFDPPEPRKQPIQAQMEAQNSPIFAGKWAEMIINSLRTIPGVIEPVLDSSGEKKILMSKVTFSKRTSANI